MNQKRSESITTTVLQKKKGDKKESAKGSSKKTRKFNNANGSLDRNAALVVAVVALTAGALYVHISIDFRHDDSGLMLAAIHETIDKRFIDLECYREDHHGAPEEEQIELAECVPKCGRAVMDNVITSEEADHFIRIPVVKKAFTKDDFEHSLTILRRLQKLVIDTFNGTLDKISDFKNAEFYAFIPGPGRYESPLFDRIHTENVAVKGVCYTALLYLSDFEVNFVGSRLSFHERLTNKTVHIVHPKRENNHRVERIISGERYAISLGLSCNKNSRPFPTYKNFSQIAAKKASSSRKYS